MGVAACTRLETACTRLEVPSRQPVSGVLLGAENRILAQPSAHEVDPEDPQLCGPPSLSQAEKLLLSPLRARSRAHTRLGAELSCDCVQINPRDIRPGTKIGSGTWR